MFVMGPIGGASLVIALKSWNRAGFLALAGTIGSILGFSLDIYIHVMLGTPVVPFTWGAIEGAVLGTSLGLALKDWRAVGALALSGAFSFGVTSQALYSIDPWLMERGLYMVETLV